MIARFARIGASGRAPWWALMLGLALIAALSIRLSFGAVPTFFIADALVPIHVSLTHWDPYYWGQARYGMLVPFIAMAFREPLANYLFQNWLTSTLGAAAFFLLAACVEQGAAAVAVGAWSLAAFLALDHEWCHSFYLSTVSQYGTGLSFGLAGLLAWRNEAKGGRGVGAVLLLLALWVDVSIPLFLVPLSLGLWAAKGSGLSTLQSAIRSRAWATLASDRSISCVIFLSAAMMLNTFLVGALHTPDKDDLLGFTAIADWPAGVLGLATRFIGSVPAGAMFFIAIVSLGSLAALVHRKARRARRRVLPVAIILVALIVVRLSVLGTSRWVHENDMDPKYMIPCRLVLFVLPVLLLIGVLADRAPRLALPPVIAGGIVAMLLAIVVRYPFVSPAVARRAMDSDTRLAKYARETVHEGCTHFIGRDQTVWPAMFYLAQLAYEGSARPVVGITRKSDPARLKWSRLALPGFKLCSPAGDPDVEAWAECLGWPPLELVQHLDTIDIWNAKGGT